MIQVFRNRTAFLNVLRHRDYRIYYGGLLASVTAHQGMIAAQGWLAFRLTGDPLTLGFVGAAMAVPGLVFNLVAGALADRFDPRKMIVLGEGFNAVLLAGLAVLVFMGKVEVWHVIATAFLVGIGTAFDQPARRVVWPVLIPRSEFVSATALNQGAWNGTRVIGPGIATGIIGLVELITGDDLFGAGVSLMVIAAGFATMTIAITFVRLPEIKRAGGATVVHDIADGLVFVAKHRVLLLIMGLSFSVGYFGLSYQQLLPALAEDNLRLDVTGLGGLYVASGLGGIAGIVVAASFGATVDRAKLIAFGAVLLGASLIAFGVTGWLRLVVLAYALGALAGALYSVFQIGANTLLNLLVPVEYRGRVMGLRGIMWSLSPLGALQAGFIASVTSTPFAIGFGGAMVLLITVAVFAFSRQVRNVEEAVAEMDAIEAAKERERAG